jgi:hypothetical protein
MKRILRSAPPLALEPTELSPVQVPLPSRPLENSLWTNKGHSPYPVELKVSEYCTKNPGTIV